MASGQVQDLDREIALTPVPGDFPASTQRIWNPKTVDTRGNTPGVDKIV